MTGEGDLPETTSGAPRWLGLTILVSSLLLACYWWFSFRGVYRWLAELQLSLFEAYYPVITGVFTFAATSVCAAVLTLLCAKLFPATGPKRTERDLQRARETRARIERISGVVYKYVYAVGIAGTSIAIACVGAAELWEAAQITEHEPIELAQVAELKGDGPYELRIDAASPQWRAELSFGSSSAPRHFIPLLSPVHQQAPVIVVVQHHEIDRLSPENAASQSFAGVLRREALPGWVRTQYEDAGVIGQRYWFLDYGESARALAESGRDEMRAACVVLGIALLAWGFVYFREYFWSG